MRNRKLKSFLACAAAAALLLAGGAGTVPAAESGVTAGTVAVESPAETGASGTSQEAAESGSASAESGSTQSAESKAESTPSVEPGTSSGTNGTGSQSTPSGENGNAASEAVTPDPANTQSAAAKAANADEPSDQETEGLFFGWNQSISGSDSTDKTFTIDVYATNNSYRVSGDPVLTDVTSGTLTSSEAAYFLTDGIRYDEEGTFYYVVREENAGQTESGWTGDSKEYHFAVEVEKVQTATDTNEFRVSSIRCESGGLDSVSWTFENVPYTPANGSTAAAGGTFTIKSNENFTDDEKDLTRYSLYTADRLSDLVDARTGELKSSLGTAAATAEWSAVSGQRDANTWSLTLNGLNSAKTQYAVLVRSNGTRSTDSGTSGNITWTEEAVPSAVFELKTTRLDTADDAGAVTGTSYPTTWTVTVPGLVFTNTYAVSGNVTGTIEITNTVTGENAPTEAFHFTVSHNGTVQNRPEITDSGETTVSKTFQRTGTYTYTVAETAGSTSGMTYDSTSYYVVFTVSDAGDGTLSVSGTVHKGSVNGEVADAVTFENSYSEPQEVTGEFTFTAVDSDDTSTVVGGSVFTLYGIKGTEGTSDYTKAADNLAKGKVRTSQLTKITDIESDNEGSVTLPDLKGDTYYVVIQKSAAEGYQKSANPVILHTNLRSGEVTATVTDSGDSTFSTGDDQWPQHPVKVVFNMRSSSGAFLTNARLSLKDSEGNVIETWKSGTSGHPVNYLVAGQKYTVTQTNRLVGYTKAKDVTFTVDAHDVTTSDYTQYVTITSRKNGTGSANGGSGSSSNRTNGAKTGDTSPIIPLVIVLCAAAAVIVVIFARRKKD